MSWTAVITVTTASSGGVNPIAGALIEWSGGQTSTDSSGNASAFFGDDGPAVTTFTASAGGYEPQQLTAGDPDYGYSSTVDFELYATGSGGTVGGGGTGSGDGCFIATAAYGSEAAPEVKFLQGFRDNVLRRTRWGHRFFERLWKHYYRISPPIAQEIRRDPELRQVVRWAIVEPWLNYMKLVMSRPDLHAMNLEGMDPKLVAFLHQFQAGADKWLKSIELPRTFKGRDPEEAVHELNIILGMVLLRTQGRAYLHDLEKRAELPLQYPKVYEGRLRSALADAGRTEDEIIAILHGNGRA